MELVYKEARALRRITLAALAAASVAALVSVFAVFHMVDGLDPVPQAMRPELGEAPEALAPLDTNFTAGWYRVQFNTILRASPAFDSPRVRLLSMGQSIYALEKRGRRVHVDAPAPGWMSMSTADGLELLRRIEEGGASGRGQRGDPSSRIELRNSDAQLQRAAEKLKEVRSRLRGTAKEAKDFPKDLAGLLKSPRDAAKLFAQGAEGTRKAVQASKRAVEGLERAASEESAPGGGPERGARPPALLEEDGLPE